MFDPDDKGKEHKGAEWYYDMETGELVLGLYVDDNWYYDINTGELRMGWLAG